MGNNASKRRGRPRKPLLDAQINGQIEGDDATSAGHGQISTIRDEASGNIGTKSQTEYERLVTIVTEHNLKHRKDIIVRCWYSDTKGQEIIATNIADVQLLVGESAYQLSTSEIVKL